MSVSLLNGLICGDIQGYCWEGGEYCCRVNGVNIPVDDVFIDLSEEK